MIDFFDNKNIECVITKRDIFEDLVITIYCVIVYLYSLKDEEVLEYCQSLGWNYINDYEVNHRVFYYFYHYVKADSEND
jgi:hypothetical protein